MKLSLSRRIDLLIGCICLCSLVCAAYLQYYLKLAPCPLCIIQRLLLTILGFVSFISGLCNLSQIFNRCLHRCNLGLITLGAVFASHQIWLEHNAMYRLTSCRESLDPYIQSLSFFTHFFNNFFQSTVDCGTSQGSFLYLSASVWLLFLFFILGILVTKQLCLDKNINDTRHFCIKL